MKQLRYPRGTPENAFQFHENQSFINLLKTAYKNPIKIRAQFDEIAQSSCDDCNLSGERMLPSLSAGFIPPKD